MSFSDGALVFWDYITKLGVVDKPLNLQKVQQMVTSRIGKDAGFRIRFDDVSQGVIGSNHSLAQMDSFLPNLNLDYQQEDVLHMIYQKITGEVLNDPKHKQVNIVQFQSIKYLTYQSLKDAPEQLFPDQLVVKFFMTTRKKGKSMPLNRIFAVQPTYQGYKFIELDPLTYNIL